MFIFYDVYVSDFFVCYSFFIFIMAMLSRGQIVHDEESGFPPKGVSGSPHAGFITARREYLRRAPVQL